jgi:hypothetical protein
MLVLYHHQRRPQVAPSHPDDVEAIIRTNAAQNINRFFITDDDSARNKNWEGFSTGLSGSGRSRASNSR